MTVVAYFSNPLRWHKKKLAKNQFLTLADIRRVAKNIGSNYKGSSIISPRIKLRCRIDMPYLPKPLLKGQIVYAWRLCDTGKWKGRISLNGDNHWIRVKNFEIVK